MKDRSVRITIILASILLALIAVVLFYSGVERYRQFRNFQTVNAQTLAGGVAVEVSHFLSEKQRLVSVFAEEHIDTLVKLLHDPEHYEAPYDYLKQRAEKFFPDVFAVSVFNSEGQPLIEDFDGFVGEVCINDTRQFLHDNQPRTRIHPNPVAYHFDVMAPWRAGQDRGVLFISFHADFLGRLLRLRQIPGHELLLVDKKAGNLIEVTPDGARTRWVRDDYRMQPQELARVLVSLPVTDSRWHVYSLHSPHIFDDEIRRIAMRTAVIFSVFLAVILISLYIFVREAKRRQRAEKSKNEFISLVSHELRTPLTPIRGTLGLISNGVTGNVDEKTRNLAAMALANTEHLCLLVDDLLDLQKLGAGKLEFKKQIVDIMPIVEQSLQSYAAYAIRFGAEFRLTERFEGRIYADPHRIEQVLANLLSNAVKYGAEKDVIDVAVHEYDGRIRISITDHGKGVPVEFQPKLFEAFAQSSEKRENLVKGTGLGLYISKAIVMEHAGDIGFSSSAGKGSTFFVEFPMCE